MAHVFTFKSNANRKVRATVQQYPDSCKAADFTVEQVEGGFVIRMTVRDEAGQAFARYHDFDYAVPVTELAVLSPADMEAVQKAISNGTFAGLKEPTKEQSKASQPEAQAAASAGAPGGGVLDMPDGFKLGRAAPAGDVIASGAARDAAIAAVTKAPERFDMAAEAHKAAEARGLENVSVRKTDDEAYLIVGSLAALKARKSRAPAALAAPAPKKAPHVGPGKFATIREAAERGELPPVADFSAALHKRNRGRLARLVAMAERGDVASLEAFPIKLNCTSPKAMDRYRNLCVTALKARTAAPCGR